MRALKTRVQGISELEEDNDTVTGLHLGNQEAWDVLEDLRLLHKVWPLLSPVLEIIADMFESDLGEDLRACRKRLWCAPGIAEALAAALDDEEEK